MKNRIVTTTVLELRKQLKALSNDKQDFHSAAEEWYLINYHFDTTGASVCACGQKAMKHVYTIKNMLNGNILTVGVRCAEHIFNNRYGVLMFYLKRTTKTRNWVFTKGMIQYVLDKEWVNTEEALLMEQYITQKSRPFGKAIHNKVCQSTRKCLYCLREHMNVDKLTIERILNNIV